MRTLPALFASLSLTVSGCGMSTVDSEATVTVSGRALDSSGAPLADAPVLLIRQADIGQVVFGSILAVGTLSSICFAPNPPAICDKARTATTDGDGRYVFEITGADTQGSLGTEATMNVVFSGRSAKTSTTVSFVARDEEVTVPDARLWNLDADVAQRAGGIQLSWHPLSRSAGAKASYSAQLYDAGTGTALWTQPASGGRADLDPRLLEDKDGAVAVGAAVELDGGEGIGEARASYLSPRLPVRSSAGAPPSRGRSCAPVTGTGPTVGRFRKPCAAADGDLTAPAKLTAKGGNPVTGVVVDLGRPRPVSLVVARGFSGQVLVEISTDGTTYRTVASGIGLAYAAEPAGRPAARYVRLRSPVGLDESLSAELSVW